MKNSQLQRILTQVEDEEVWAESSFNRTAIYVGNKLVARVRTGSKPNGLLNAGNLLINTKTLQVRVNNVLVPLKSATFKVLIILVENTGSIVEREFLNMTLWGGHIAPHTIDVHISSIRRALVGTEWDHKLVTVRGIGFIIDPNST